MSCVFICFVWSILADADYLRRASYYLLVTNAGPYIKLRSFEMTTVYQCAVQAMSYNMHPAHQQNTDLCMQRKHNGTTCM